MENPFFGKIIVYYVTSIFALKTVYKFETDLVVPLLLQAEEKFIFLLESVTGF